MSSSVTDRPSSSMRRLLVLALLPALAGGLVYLNALRNPPVWDDFRTIVDNHALDDLSDVRSLAFRDASRPVVTVSYAIDRAVWGREPFGFHVTSVALHMLNVVLIFFVARGLTRDWSSVAGERARPAAPDAVAASAAWLLAVHPMMTEAVGYISARPDVLSTTFVLASFLAIRRWVRTGSAGWLAAGIGAWIGGLLSKETAAVLPLLLAAYDLCIVRQTGAPRRGSLVRLWVGLSVAMAAVAAFRLGLLLLVENPGHTGIHWRHALVELDVMRQYTILLLLPSGQSVFHPVVAISSVLQPRALGALAFLGVLVFLLVASLRRSAAFGVGVVWYLLALAPPAVLVMLDLGHPMAEHRTYLASCGLFIALGTVVGWIVARPRPERFAWRLAVPIALGFGVATLAGMTLVRNAVWRDPVVLWMEAVESAPDIWMPHLLLAEALHARGLRELAVTEYRTVVRLRPDYADSYLKLAVCLAELNRLEEAARTFATLKQVDPSSPVGSEGLGTIALLAGDTRMARAHFADALRLDPGNVPAMQSLAMVNEREARPAEALRLCQAIEARAPGVPGTAECVARNQKRLSDAGLE